MSYPSNSVEIGKLEKIEEKKKKKEERKVDVYMYLFTILTIVIYNYYQ